MIKYYVRRKSDGYVIVEDDSRKGKKRVDEMLKRGGFELMSTVQSAEPARLVKDVPVINDELECPLDGTVCASEEALKKHKEEAHGGKTKKT